MRKSGTLHRWLEKNLTRTIATPAITAHQINTRYFPTMKTLVLTLGQLLKFHFVSNILFHISSNRFRTEMHKYICYGLMFFKDFCDFHCRILCANQVAKGIFTYVPFIVQCIYFR